jgi:hypothetical protein
MYEELIKRLRVVSNWTGIQFLDESENVRAILAEAADAIESMREMVATAYEDNANIIQSYEDSKPRWIPVTEQLPEIGTYIIAGRMKYDYENEYTHFVDVAYFGPRWNDADCSWQTFNDWCEGQQEFEITHWMPLPKPPKEET